MGEDTKSMHFYYCAGINSQIFAGAGRSVTHVAGAGGNGQKFSWSGWERDEENSDRAGLYHVTAPHPVCSKKGKRR